MDLGQVLMQMMGGTPPVGQPGTPQFAPPVGIDWPAPAPVQLPAPAPAPAQPQKITRNQGIRQETETRPSRRVEPTSGGRSTPETIDDFMNGLTAFLQSNRNRWAEEDRQSYEDARGAENTRPAAQTQAPPPPGDFDEFGNFVGRGQDAPSVSTPSQQPSGHTVTRGGLPPELTPFDVYGAPMPERKPPSLGAMMYDVPLPERRTGPEAKPPSSPPRPAAAPASGPSNRGGAASPGGSRAKVSSSFTGAPNTDDPFPQSSPLFDPLTGKFLLQMGLSLMTPQWGNSLSQIGQAAGQGAEAVDRSNKIDETSRLANAKLDVERARVQKMGLGRKGAKESSASKKTKNPMQQMAENLSPEAAIFLQTRMKALNKSSEGEDGEGGDAAAAFDEIMNATKKVDIRSRMGRGQLRSEEISDADLAAAAGDPAKELRMLQWTTADPAQRTLVLQRLQNAKANTSGGKPPKPAG